MSTLAPAPRTTSAPVPRRSSSARRASAYVITLLWVLPLLAFTVAGLRADATPCPTGDALLCNDQGTVVATGVLSAVLLIPVGLVALFLVALLACGTRRPAVVAAVATAAAVAVGLAAVGLGYLFLGVLSA